MPAPNAYWTIDFMSLNGTHYRISIGGATTNTRLQGAASPIFTQEDQSEDKFIPVRTQTGYIRIVDDGYDLDGHAFDWHDLIPTTATSRPVTLQKIVGNTTTTEWRGFIKPTTYSGDYLNTPQEREFPVVCGLSVLEGYEMPILQPSIINFAALLEYIIDTPSLPYTDMIFQGVNAVEVWLNFYVDTLNFADSDGSKKYNLLELLQEICKFWGWTARTYKDNIIFESADDAALMADEDWSVIDMEELHEIATGDHIEGSYQSFGDFDMVGDEFSDTESQEVVLQGINKAIVKADINKIDDYPAVPYDDIEKFYRSATILRDDIGVDGPNNHPVHKFYKNITCPQSKAYQYAGVTVNTYADTVQSVNYGSGFAIVDWYSGLLVNKKQLDWDCRLELYGSTDGSAVFITNNPYFSIESDYAFAFNDGVLTIASSVFVEKCTLNDPNAEYKTWSGFGYLYCVLKVGNKYWNGSAWTTSNAVFQLPFGSPSGTGWTEAEGKGEIIGNHDYSSIYENYEGYGIPIDGIGGNVTFKIMGFTLTDLHGLPQAKIIMENLKLGFARKLSVSEEGKDGTNKYEATNANKFTNEASVSTIFASYQFDNNPPGRGLVMNSADYNYIEEIEYVFESNYAHPEQHLADRMASFGATTRKLFKFNFLASEVNITPMTWLTTLENVKTYPISISHEWADNIVNVIAIEI